MTDQEVFDKVVRHLSTMTEQSRGEAGCAYRGDNGSKCAVGCLIADEDYDERMEGLGSGALTVRFRASCRWMRKHTELLRDLQRVHDDFLGVIPRLDFKRKLLFIATVNGVDPAVVEECYDE